MDSQCPNIAQGTNPLRRRSRHPLFWPELSKWRNRHLQQNQRFTERTKPELRYPRVDLQRTIAGVSRESVFSLSRKTQNKTTKKRVHGQISTNFGTFGKSKKSLPLIKRNTTPWSDSRSKSAPPKSKTRHVYTSVYSYHLWVLFILL